MNVLKVPEPVSNYERQRKFRERNPGYYNKYHARIKAECQRREILRQTEHLQQIAAQQEAETAAIDHQTGGINAISEHMV